MAKAPKSRFGSATMKKIEKQVRKDAVRFLPNVNNRRGLGVASGVNHRGKPIVDSNVGHKSNILSNQKLASSTLNASKTNNVANDANWQDNIASLLVGQAPIKDCNTRHMNSSTMNVSLDPSSNNPRKNNRRDDGVPSQLERRNLTKDKKIKHNNTSVMYSSLATLSKTDNIRSAAVEANRQVNHASQPIKQDPPRKRQVGLDNGGGFIVGKHSDRKLTIKATEEASPKQMKIQRNKEARGDDTSDRNHMGEINGDANPFGVKDYSERNLSYGSMKRQRGNTKTNEDEAIDNDGTKLMEIEDGGTQLKTHDHRPKDNKKKRGIESNELGDGKADDCFAKKNLESLPKDHVSHDCSNEAIAPEKLTHRKLKKWRQDIMRNEDELHVDVGDHNPLDAEGGSLRLTSQAPISIDCRFKVPTPFVLEHVKQQCNYSSKPIDKPVWSGIFRMDREEYISLVGHLSTKSCDKVWKLSRSLMPVVEVAKLSRSKFKIWETSRPSCDSIGLYFFPNKTRHEGDLDKLVKEVIEDDQVLQAVIDEAEMLIFPSTVLPERYKTFQRKHYLWGVFSPRQDQCATVTEPVHDTVCLEENEKEEQHASNQQDEVQQVHCKSPAKSMLQAAATRGVPWSPNMDFEPEAPEEIQLGYALRHTLHSAEAAAVATDPAAVTTEADAVVTDPAAVATEAAAFATNPDAVTTEAAALATDAATIPAEANENDTNAATIPGNHGQSDSIVGVPPGRFFFFVAGQTAKLEPLIQEMQREGSLVLAVRGEAIGGGLWPGNIASSNISRA